MPLVGQERLDLFSKLIVSIEEDFKARRVISRGHSSNYGPGGRTGRDDEDHDVADRRLQMCNLTSGRIHLRIDASNRAVWLQ